MQSTLLDVRRQPDLARRYPELKDPDLVRLPDDRYMLFTSTGRSDIQHWAVGRFLADHIEGPWFEQEPVRFHGITGPQLCASSTLCRLEDSRPRFEMHIQTACFEPDGRIVAAESSDGLNFHASARPAITRQSLPAEHGVVGVYDVGVSQLMHQGRPQDCMVLSGYRSIGSGDLYACFRDSDRPGAPWRGMQRVLTQEEVSFHNHPDDPEREWGLEGAKIVQLGPDIYLMIGVCFLPAPRSAIGTRQRVFLAGGRSPLPPYALLGALVGPSDSGETGHPDALVQGETLHLIYQERLADGAPWHLRQATLDVEKLAAMILGARLELPLPA